MIQANGEKIEWVNQFRYLGIWLEPNLLYKKQIKESLTKLKTQGVLQQRFNNLSKMPIPAIRTVYNAVSITSFSYGAGLWGSFSGQKLGEDENNKFLKNIFKLPPSTSHRLLEREIVLANPVVAKNGQIANHYIKLANAKTGLLFDCLKSMECLPHDPRNLLSKLTNFMTKEDILDLANMEVELITK